jgi:hypothetical protein
VAVRSEVLEVVEVVEVVEVDPDHPHVVLSLTPGT